MGKTAQKVTVTILTGTFGLLFGTVGGCTVRNLLRIEKEVAQLQSERNNLILDYSFESMEKDERLKEKIDQKYLDLFGYPMFSFMCFAAAGSVLSSGIKDFKNI
jgi:Na+/glutamate symporter